MKFILGIFALVLFSGQISAEESKNIASTRKSLELLAKKIERKPKEVQVWFEVPKSLSKYVVKKGSIAMDGISLTVVDVKKNQASVCLIPHTIEVTNFKTKDIGDKVNIETDILGKYILK